MKIMKKFKNALMTTILTLPLIISQSYAVGFHSAGGGGGSSRGGSYSSSGSGSGDFLLEIILYLVIAIAISIFTYISNKKKGELANAKIKHLKSLQSSHLSEDTNFSIELIESRIQNNILDVLYGLADNDEELVRTYCTDNFINLVNSEDESNEKIREGIVRELKRRAKHICWIDTKLDSIYSDEAFDYIKLKLSFKTIDETGFVYPLNNITVVLKRRDKVITESLNQTPKLKNCKSCGAPMDFNATHTCEYCGHTSRLSEDDTWMIDDLYTSPSDYSSSDIRDLRDLTS